MVDFKKEFGIDSGKVLVRYITRNGKNNAQRVGVLVGFEHDKKILIGFSLCKNIDKMDKDFGIRMAIKRAFRWDKTKKIGIIEPKSGYYEFEAGIEKTIESLIETSEDVVYIPFTVGYFISSFKFRCESYYKEAKLTNWAVNISNG